jgi:hypothetical protein
MFYKLFRPLSKINGNGNGYTVTAKIVAHTKKGNFVMVHNKCVADKILANAQVEGYSDVVYKPKYHLFSHPLGLGCTVIWIIRLPPNPSEGAISGIWCTKVTYIMNQIEHLASILAQNSLVVGPWCVFYGPSQNFFFLVWATIFAVTVTVYKHLYTEKVGLFTQKEVKKM